MSKLKIGYIELSRGANRAESAYWHERPKMNKEILSTGETVVYDESSTKIVRGVLVVDFLHDSEAHLLEAYISDVLRILGERFTITPDECTNLGAGLGVALTDCVLDTPEASTEGIITPQGNYGRWKLRLPYRAVVEVILGVGVEE